MIRVLAYRAAGLAVLALFPVIVVFDYLMCRLLGISATWRGSARAAWRTWCHNYWQAAR